MKTPDPNQERLMRWLDGAMTPAEQDAFRRELESNPALRAELDSLQEIGGLVRRHAPLERSVPNPDFFNARLQEEIAADQNRERRTTAKTSTGWVSWLRAPWLAAGAAALIALAFVLFRESAPQTQVVSFYVPDPGVKASVNYSAAAEATVLTLDGLHAIPDDAPVSGLRVHHSENDPEYAATTLFGADGRVLLVMATDAGHRPVLLGHGAQP